MGRAGVRTRLDRFDASNETDVRYGIDVSSDRKYERELCVNFYVGDMETKAFESISNRLFFRKTARCFADDQPSVKHKSACRLSQVVRRVSTPK